MMTQALAGGNYIKMFGSSVEVKYTFWMLLHLNILWIILQRLHYTKNID